MKIGIITFWQSYDNYGQLLQCWALQQQLIQMGHEPFLIRYNFTEFYDTDPLWKWIARRLLILPYLKRREILKNKCLHKKKNECREFDSFREKHLMMSELYYPTPYSLVQNPPDADAYITGSDQVWAQLVGTDRNMPFYLCFGKDNVRKISYAASFAMKSYPTHLNGLLKEALGHFYAISVREADGVNICMNVGFEAAHVLDPTLLLNRKTYYDLLPSVRLSSNSVYIYSVNISDAKEMRWTELKDVCNRYKFNIVVTTASGCIEGNELFGKEVLYDYASIPQWLSNIANAKMVITTSFHGVVFSLIFHTPFIYVPLKGLFAGGNNRAEEILKRVGLADRILCDEQIVEQYFVKEIDWKKVDEELSSLRINSEAFLRNALS